MKPALQLIGGFRTVLVGLVFAFGVYKLKTLKIELDPTFYAFATGLFVVAAGHGAQRVINKAKATATEHAILAVRRETELAKATLHSHADSELRRMDHRCKTSGYDRLEHG
jgi:hypothetical protein